MNVPPPAERLSVGVCVSEGINEKIIVLKVKWHLRLSYLSPNMHERIQPCSTHTNTRTLADALL